MVILRVHEILKSHLIDKKALEFRWRQNWDTHGDHDIRTQVRDGLLAHLGVCVCVCECECVCVVL